MTDKIYIHEICGDWALDIPFPGLVTTLYFNSRANAELVKAVLEWEKGRPNEAVPYPPELSSGNESGKQGEISCREKMTDLIINAKKTEPENGSFTEYLADFLLSCGVKLPERQNKRQVNADLIRTMEDEELAMIIMCPNESGLGEIPCDKNDNCDCYTCCLEWLRKEKRK